MQELESNIQNLDVKIHSTEATLKNLLELKEKINTKTAVRRHLFEEQERQHRALEEENEGLPSLSLFSFHHNSEARVSIAFSFLRQHKLVATLSRINKFCLHNLFLLHFWLDTDEELKEWKIKFEERTAVLMSKISKWEREINDTKTKSELLKDTEKEYIREISRLQTEADVHYLSTYEIGENYMTMDMSILINYLLNFCS